MFRLSNIEKFEVSKNRNKMKYKKSKNFQKL